MFAPDTQYDEGIRRQFAALTSALILGPDNNWTGEDAGVRNTVYRDQGVTPDGRVFTPGLSNGTAPAGQSVGANTLLVVALVVVAVLLVKA